MITYSQIPSEALDAAVKAYETSMLDIASREALGVSILAAINAWPGATYANWRAYGQADRFVLPLLKETE